MINLSNLSDALTYLVNENNSFEQIKTDFPEIIADWVSMKNNPNCTCRGRVNKFFQEKLMTAPDLLNKYVSDVAAFHSKISEMANQRLQNNYIGKMFIIPKGEESWKNFASQTTGKTYRSFSVVERETDLVVYFL